MFLIEKDDMYIVLLRDFQGVGFIKDKLHEQNALTCSNALCYNSFGNVCFGTKRTNRLNKRPAMSEHLALYAGLFYIVRCRMSSGRPSKPLNSRVIKLFSSGSFFDARFAGSIIAMRPDISGVLQAAQPVLWQLCSQYQATTIPAAA